MNIFPVILPAWLAVILACASSCMVTWYTIPLIIRVSLRLNITDKPRAHKIHHNNIPTMGGMGIFTGFIFGLLLTVDGSLNELSAIIAALILLLFTGIRDDLLPITPFKKIVIQVTSGLIIATFTDLRFTNLHGFLGCNEISVFISFLITIFLVVIIINSFNLIDGIDGLASSIGIIISSTYGVWFYMSGDYGYAIMASALIGALLIFFFFNISEGKNKIFMGDTGSMVIGFIIIVMTIRFNEINAAGNSIYKLVSSPSVSVAILIIPLFDTLRVIVIRLIRRKGLFVADNRHIHHLLLRTGCSHLQATLLISVANLFFIAVAFLLDGLGITKLAFVLLATGFILTLIVYIKVAYMEKWNWSAGILKTIMKND